MEIINYYNEKNSEKLGCADRNYVHNNNLWHREIAVWLMNNNKEILLERRKEKPTDPDLRNVQICRLRA